MRGRYKFEAAAGSRQDINLVRTDFNKTKPIEKIRFGESFIFYQGIRKWFYVDYTDIVWAYRRLEDVQGKLCCGVTGFEIHSLMIVTKDKKRIGMLLEDRENAVYGLETIQKHNPFVDIGFSKEKEEKYL